MSVELVVTIRDEEKRKLTREFLIYEPIAMSEQDPVIDKCVKEAIEEFKGIPDDIKIKATMILR